MLDSSVLIRTLEGSGGAVSYGTGCGITADSSASEEWAESVLKTAPVLGAMPAMALRETCRVVGATVPLWRLHRGRLRAGGCGQALIAEVERAVDGVLGDQSGGREGSRLGVVVTPEGAVEVTLSTQPSTLDVPGGPVVARVEAPAGMPDLIGLAKPADREWWDVAHRLAVSAGAHQAIIVDCEGNLVDGSTSAVWLVEGGSLLTVSAPPAVASVSAAFVREQAAREGIDVRTEPISWERFCAADEAFLTNALGGCAAIRGRGGPTTELVSSWFDRAWSGELGDLNR